MYFRGKKKDANTVSINDPLESDSDGNTLSLIDILSTEDTINDKIDLETKTKKLYQLIENIPNDREKKIIISRYGLYDKKELTQREIAAEMGISRSYVSRIEKKVLNELREKMGEK